MSDSSNQPPIPSAWSDTENRLDSWKEIAVYLERTPATVRRWEKEEGLPVHRHVHHKKAQASTPTDQRLTPGGKIAAGSQRTAGQAGSDLSQKTGKPS